MVVFTELVGRFGDCCPGDFNPLNGFETRIKVTTGDKVTKVELDCPTTLNTTEEFEINHAERLLRMPNNGGWQLPERQQF
ncbi:MAG: hypothetical protein ACLU99_14965 [Alphaproteobacteria bacterium]